MDITRQPPTSMTRHGRRILILNWRCPRSPLAGGAEKVTHEIARRWVQWGHQVTLFCAAFDGAPDEEVIDGVRVIRRGSQYSVYWQAFRHYRKLFRGQYDLIVDQVHAVPFFAHLYAREPVVMFKHQLEREVWLHEARFPVSVGGFLAEPMLLQAYRRVPIMTVSESTRSDLHRLGLRGPCTIIPEAVDANAPDVLPSMEVKERDLTLVFVGRVVPSKRVHHIVSALKAIHEAGLPGARLWILGPGNPEYRGELERLIGKLGLGEAVRFFGRVDETTKAQLLMRAHVIVMTSVREGWGLVVTEANLQGTPAVVYDIPGLRDSTRDGETGLVARRNTPRALAESIVTLHQDPNLYARLRLGAWRVASELSWDRTASAAWNVVEAVVQQGGAVLHEQVHAVEERAAVAAGVGDVEGRAGWLRGLMRRPSEEAE